MSGFKKSEKPWKWAVSVLCILLALSLTGCTIPTPGFADYDVSGYIRALLDSSYHGSHEDLMEIAKITEAQAMENNTTTVENAAVHFCNTYDLSPSESQLQELQMIMKQAFALTKYTVKEERRVDTGYYLEVEIAPITNFSDKGGEIEALRAEARQEALSGGEQSANDLFVDKVLDLCIHEVANISYDTETRTVALDIRQTEEGELQLDLNQIETIDKNVVRFS